MHTPSMHQWSPPIAPPRGESSMVTAHCPTRGESQILNKLHSSRVVDVGIYYSW